MNVLFIHQNFPAQFRHLADALSQQPGARVFAIGSETARDLGSVTVLRYSVTAAAPQTHGFARFFDAECRRAEQILYVCMQLKAQAFEPDVIIVHSGWGEALPLRSAFPRAFILLYVEMFYRRHGADVDFDPEFPPMSLDGLVGLSARNASTVLGLTDCDAAITPTAWQRSTFPANLQPGIDVIHEGIDIELAKPNPQASVKLPNGAVVTAGDPVVTFVARDLEPLRGYHTFMRALPEILARHRGAQVLIVGREGTSYGAAPPPGRSWKSIFLDEVSRLIDTSRVHFLGRLPYADYLNVLQVSAAHIYLTYPFVLSWSMLEALASGCVVVGSSTPPVREVITGDNGVLVDFFDPSGVAAAVLSVLGNPGRYEPMRLNARQTIVDHYDRRACVDNVLKLLRLRGSTAPTRWSTS